jgi:hypothetical protein
VGDHPSPLAAEEVQRAIEGLPREPSVIELFKLLLAPTRFLLIERRSR